MKSTAYKMIETIQILNPARNAQVKEIVKHLVLHQANGAGVFVDEVIITNGETFIYVRSSDDELRWQMLPLDQLVGFEVELKNPKNPWHKDARTMPEIVAKLRKDPT